MGVTAKRKATEDDIDEDLDTRNNVHQPWERRTLIKKRGTSILDQDRSTLALFTNGQADLLPQQKESYPTSQSRASHVSPESKHPNGFVPAALMNTMLSTNNANISVFQRALTQFCSTYGSLFGPSYVSDLKTAHWTVASSNDAATIRSAGHDFLVTLSRYINDLQATAMAQIRLRATLVEVGVEKDVLEGIDAVVGMLDRQIIGLGTEMQGLEWQLSSVADLENGDEIVVEVVMNG
ncbi:hypothetical protein AC578_8372 [Pseudocercospora eumusae]|uniref:Uncharacterized protein n=1 Tax=Pseudocercospora eumusae TaxID=321146 RepID=A0A139HRZ8_9PEZI|nr:hypothetical protein AC578_8372 [Pseudocercospora eumusae]